MIDDTDLSTPAEADTTAPIVAESDTSSEIATEDDEDAELAAVWDKHQGDGKPEDGDEAEPVAGQERAPDGKYKAKEAPEGAPAAAVVEMPRSWGKADEATWAKMPPEAQTRIAEREQQFAAKISEYGEVFGAARPLFEAVDAVEPILERHNTSAAELVTQAAEWLNALDTNPYDALARLAQSRGVDLRAVAQMMYSGQPQQAVNPDMLRLQVQNDVLMRQQQAFEADRAARERAVTEFEMHQTAEGLERMSEAFFAGKPEMSDSEFQADVEAEIHAVKARSPHLSPQNVLQEAYDRAIWANPKTRAARQAEVDRQRQETARKAATRAKAANSINVYSEPSSTTPADDDEAMRQVWRRHRTG